MKIKQVHLHTSCLANLEKFYVQKLGFEKVNEDLNSFTIQTGKSQLCFSSSVENAFYHFAFNIPENQLEMAIKYLKNKQIELLKYNDKEVLDFPNWNAHAIYFFDVAGNIVEFIARHDLNNFSNIVFDTSCITEISEVGFPVPSIQTFYEKIQKNWDIPVYSHASNLETFCAIGNPEGLFIIVSLEKQWLPTTKACAIFPIEVVIESTKNKIQKIENLPYTVISEIIK